MFIECDHPADDLEYTSGNYVAPYGWETYPGWYCTTCGIMVEMFEDDEPDPDREYDARREAAMDRETV